MAKTTLTISSKNYSSWSLRGWLLAKFSGLPFEEVVTAPDDAARGTSHGSSPVPVMSAIYSTLFVDGRYGKSALRGRRCRFR